MRVTAEELFWHRDEANRSELVRGQLRLAPFAHMLEADISTVIAVSLATWVRKHRLGKVYAPCGFIPERDPDTVRAPDCAFVRTERVIDTDYYFPGAPDLAVEVVAVTDTLEVDDVVPGWKMPLAEVFEE